MAAVDDEDGERKCCGEVSGTRYEEENKNEGKIRTVAEDELADTGDVHGDAAKEVVCATDGSERCSHDS